jgi:outer membrane protein OmpA-like peptidoglycan-associated protein
VKIKLYILSILTLLNFNNINLFSNELELTREFNVITSKNASGYLKPLFTTIGEGFNTSLFNTSYHSNGWSFGLNFSFSGTYIPESQLLFDAELPDLYGNSSRVRTAQSIDGKLIENLSGTAKQPTIYGGESYSIFAASQNSAAPDTFYKSVGFLEGHNIKYMPALPIAQIYVGLPTRTELRFRFFTFSMLDAPLTYFSVAISQNIDKLFEINKPDDSFSFGIFASYHFLKRNSGIDINSYSIGINSSKIIWDKLTLFSGLQYEDFFGNVLLVRKNFNDEDVLNSPYSEIRNGEDLDINVESFTKYRITLGLAYDWSIFRFHGDIAYSSQPIYNFGISVKLLEHQEEYFNKIEYIPAEPDIQSFPPIAQSNFTNPYLPHSQYIPVFKEKIWNFDISLDLLGISENNISKLDTIIIEEFESRQTRAVLPYIFYDEGESDIPSRYNLISQDDSKSFNYAQLSGKSSLESYYDLLNVIGLRMTQKQNAKLILTGTNSNIGIEKNNKSLSKKRAENIKNYFTAIWGIDESRIKIESRNLPKVPSSNNEIDGQEENRRVEINSNDLEIISPVFIIDTLLKIQPNGIQYLPKVNSEAGLKNWELSSTSNGVTLKHFSGNSEINNNYQWYLDSEGSKKRQLSNTLKTKLTASDKENNVREISLSNPIKVISVKDKRLNANKDTLLNVYNLILFDFNSSKLNSSNISITNFIKSDISPQSEINILGFTDRIGDEKYNLKLSTERAESSGKALGGHPYKVNGLGESKHIYDNNLPEGRFYSRTVIIEAKVPIN